MSKFFILLILLFLSTLSTNADTDCGLIKVQPPATFLAFNATPAYPGQWPWLASLFHSKKGFVCGSSIISKWHLLTAAHCVISEANDYHALLGRFDLSNSDEIHWIRRNMSAVYVHPDFDASAETRRSNGDIAIFRVAKKITLTDYIQPICLPQPTTNVIGVSGTFAGYGKTEIYGKYENKPNYAVLRSNSSWECLGTNIKYGLIISERSFCAGSESSITCQGDSGSGYFVLDKSTHQHTIYGIVSIAIGLCDPKDYAAFVDVTKFIPWINEKMNDEKFADDQNNSCEESECGENSECTIVNNKAKCSCEEGILGSPPYCGSKCDTNLDCSDDRKCSDKICTDSCLKVSMCAENSVCVMKNHRPECECKNGFEGNENSDCTKIISENILEKKIKELEAEKERVRLVEEEKQRLLIEQKEREEEFQKTLNEKLAAIEEEKRQAVDIYNPVHSSKDKFVCKYRFLAPNYMELRLTLSSAKGLVNALAKLSSYQFRTYYFAFIDRIEKDDKTGNVSGGIMQSDYENILEKITSGTHAFQSIVETLEKSGQTNKYAYVKSYRSYNYNDLKSSEVFVIDF